MELIYIVCFGLGWFISVKVKQAHGRRQYFRELDRIAAMRRHPSAQRCSCRTNPHTIWCEEYLKEKD